MVGAGVGARGGLPLPGVCWGSPSCQITTPTVVARHFYEKNPFLAAREGFKNSSIWADNMKCWRSEVGDENKDIKKD